MPADIGFAMPVFGDIGSLAREMIAGMHNPCPSPTDAWMTDWRFASCNRAEAAEASYVGHSLRSYDYQSQNGSLFLHFGLF